MADIRPVRTADREAVGEFLARVSAADGLPAFSEFKATGIARGDGRTVGGFSMGSLVSMAHAAWHHGDDRAAAHWAVEVAVAPDRRRHDRWEQIVRAGVDAVPDGERHVVWSASTTLSDVLGAMGYSARRHLSVMERPLPTNLDDALPAAIRLAAFRPGHDEFAWLAVNNASFAGHPENGGLTSEDLAARMASDWFLPEDLLMAWDGGRLAGSCWTKRHPSAIGEIYVIGVHPGDQRRGLGRALVIAGLNHLAEAAGARTGMLYVDQSETAAVRLYEGLGFVERRVISMYDMSPAIG